MKKDPKQRRFLNTETMTTTAAMRRLRRERQKKEMPWLFEGSKRVGQPTEVIEQMQMEKLDDSRPVAKLFKSRCPMCYASAELWRLVEPGKPALFQVRCLNKDFELPVEPVPKAQDAVAAWRLAVELSK